jgi:methyl-accepting chemotaxis protein
MNLRIKILSGFLILSIMLLTAGALSIYELNKIGHSVKVLLDENYKSIDATKTMIEALEREDSGVLLLMSGDWDNGRSTIKKADNDFQKAFDVAENNITIPGEKEYIETIKAAYASYKKLWVHPIVDTQRENNLQWYYGNVHPAFLKSKAAVNRLMTLNDKTMYQTASALQNRAGRAIMPGIVAIVSALVFTIIFNFFINLYVILPIKRLTAGIQNYIKSGDQTGFRVDSSDELSDLSKAICDFIAYIKQDEK